MFDMGFTELMLIGIVALVVIGPERLPGVARTAGKYVGRLKRFMTTVKADVEQELRADELRQILSEQQKELDSLKDTISEAGRDIEKDVGVNEAVAHSEAVVASVVDEAAHDKSQPAAPASSEPAAAKPVTKKAAVKQAVARKSAAKKPALKKPTPKTPAIKKSVGKKAKSKTDT